MTGIKRFLLFSVMIAITVVILRIFNWIPDSLYQDRLSRYKDLEEARTSLGIRRLYLPAYFPQNLKWPPSEIYAQKRPYVMVLTQFVDRESGAVTLAIRQTESGHPETLKSRIEPYKIGTQETAVMKGRQARVSLGKCRDGEACNSVRWSEDGFDFELVVSDSEKEMLKIAESMLIQ